MFKVHILPAFSDNYLFVLSHSNGQAAIIDPGDAQPVLDFLNQQKLQLTAILITHHHSDHVGGIDELLAAYPDCPVYASAKIRQCTQPVIEGDIIPISATDNVKVLEVAGHTADHIAFYGQNSLFCGDTLFACGCGKVFTGSSRQLYASLAKLRQLPDDSLVYCAHEYTLDNIAFAKWVEPHNADLLARETEAKALRAKQQPTVPSLLSLEKKINPFLRFDEDVVIAAAEQFAGKKLSNGAAVFIAVRDWKDNEFD
jgi:hydroxyacylglutathione hydrolase